MPLFLLRLLMQAEREHKRAVKKAEKNAAKTCSRGNDKAVWEPSDEQLTRHLELHGLSAKQRAILHEAATAVGMQHESRDVSGARILYLGDVLSNVCTLPPHI
jgi:hypothetical protein